VEDSAASFASAVMRLLHDAGAQARMSQQALNVARERFGADVCYGPLLAALLQANESTRCSVQG
jgi:hypothetical protein